MKLPSEWVPWIAAVYDSRSGSLSGRPPRVRPWRSTKSDAESNGNTVVVPLGPLSPSPSALTAVTVTVASFPFGTPVKVTEPPVPGPASATSLVAVVPSVSRSIR